MGLGAGSIMLGADFNYQYIDWHHDAIEDEAFEIYKELVKPLQAMPKVFNDVLMRKIKKAAQTE